MTAATSGEPASLPFPPPGRARPSAALLTRRTVLTAALVVAVPARLLTARADTSDAYQDRYTDNY